MESYFIKNFFWTKRRLIEIILLPFITILYYIFSNLIEHDDDLFELTFLIWLSLFAVLNAIMLFSDYLLLFPKKSKKENESIKAPIEISYIVDMLIYFFSHLVLIFLLISFFGIFDQISSYSLSSTFVLTFMIALILFLLIKITYLSSKKHIFVKLLSTKKKDLVSIRKLVYIILFIILLILIYISALNSPSENFTLELPFQGRISTQFIVIYIVGILITNIFSTILICYSVLSLRRFEDSYELETTFLWTIGLKNYFNKKYFSNALPIVVILVLFLGMIRQLVTDKPSSIEDFLTIAIKGFYQTCGLLLIFISLIWLYWFIIRSEDIIAIKESLKFTNDLKLITKTDSKLKIKVLNELKDNFSNNKIPDKKERTLWKIIIIKKIHLLLDGLDGLLIGSLPIIFLGITSYLIGKILININFENVEEIVIATNGTDMINSILFISALYSTVVMIVYQGGRQLIIRKLKKSLKDKCYHQEYDELLKDFDSYLDRPDIVTSTIIILLPIISLILRYLPEVLKVTSP